MTRFTVTWSLGIEAPTDTDDEMFFAEIDRVLEQLLALENSTGELHDSTISVDLVSGTVEISLDVHAPSDADAQHKSVNLVQQAIDGAGSKVSFRMTELLSLK